MRPSRSDEVVKRVVGWHVARWADRRGVPFYCDSRLVGSFAVEPKLLAVGAPTALFKLFITLSMYQGLRDVVVMRRQKSLGSSEVKVVADLASVMNASSRHRCAALGSADSFVKMCTVEKAGKAVECATWRGVPCHVKEATEVFNRMGDMGKLPTSAWLSAWRGDGLSKSLARVCRDEPSPTKRADILVTQFARIHRVGRKLATLFVSALTFPPLAPGLTPWYPEVDGSALIVVDTNVARAVDILRGAGASKSYHSREQWVRNQAARINLRAYHPELPSYSPRFVQEALYMFCSKSNRTANEDACDGRLAPCGECASVLCPFSS